MVAKGMVGGLSSKGLSAAMRAAKQPKKNIASLYKIDCIVRISD